jgi:hypothetical protein
LRPREWRQSRAISDEQRWAVPIVIPDYEWATIDNAGTRIVGPDHYMVVLPWEDGPTTVLVDARALTAEQG